MMNQRNKIKIQEKLTKIQLNNFNVDDVEILLINIREFAREKEFKLLLEICDFVAHPNRDKGIIYDEFDVAYSKFKYMPTQKGDQLDYKNIKKDVFNLLFHKGIDQLTEEYLINKFGKSGAQLKQYITFKLVQKKGSVYTGKNENAINELRDIQNICNQSPQIEIISEDNLFNEIKICVANLAKTIDFEYDEISFNRSKNDLILSFFEIIQNCIIQLHDGNKAEGFISVDRYNTKYINGPAIENLNLSFSAQIPIEQSFAIFPIIQSKLFLGDLFDEPENAVYWHNKEHTSGRLKPFKIDKKI